VIIFFYLMPIVVVATIGIRIWRSGAAHVDGAEKQTLRFLGLNLIEPAINMFVVIGLIVLFKAHFVEEAYFSAIPPPPLWGSFGPALLLTLPVAVLLLPIKGWNSPHAGCRQINRELVAIGLLRWSMSALTLIWSMALWAGMAIFVGSVWWVNRQAGIINQRDSAPQRPR
jgi:hypothetical protein